MTSVSLTIGGVDLELLGDAQLTDVAQRQYQGFLHGGSNPWRVTSVLDASELVHPSRMIVELERRQIPWLVRSRHFTAELDPQQRTATVYYRPSYVKRDDVIPGAIHFALRAIVSIVTILDGGVVLHGSGVVLRGEAIGFFGPSEAGKTTIAYQLQSAASATLLADDVIVVTDALGEPQLHSTPFSGNEQPIHTRVRNSGPFAHACTLIQATRDLGQRAVDRAEAFRTFMRAPIVPYGDAALEEQALRQAEALFAKLTWHTVAFDLNAETTAKSFAALK